MSERCLSPVPATDVQHPDKMPATHLIFPYHLRPQYMHTNVENMVKHLSITMMLRAFILLQSEPIQFVQKYHKYFNEHGVIY